MGSVSKPASQILDKEIPRLADDPKHILRVQQAQRTAKTSHRLYVGDARDLGSIKSESVHLILTSPPYWNLKRYPDHPAQLGNTKDYEAFLNELDRVWEECFRVLVPGGRLICVVGDVCLSRRQHGRHVVVPLHADIAVRCRLIGFDNLAPIIWYKIANASYEVENGSKFFGKPYEPNAIIKHDIEYILMERKPGGYRKPTPEQRRLSVIPKGAYDDWFQQIWHVPGASTQQHPAPFPFELASRLVKMYSFFGDAVLDPFCGTGTTMVAALEAGRNSIGFEIDADYAALARKRLEKHARTLFRKCDLELIDAREGTETSSESRVSATTEI